MAHEGDFFRSSWLAGWVGWTGEGVSERVLRLVHGFGGSLGVVFLVPNIE